MAVRSSFFRLIEFDVPVLYQREIQKMQVWGWSSGARVIELKTISRVRAEVKKW
jgi:hypothetical protein